MTFSEDSSDDDEYTPGRETNRDMEVWLYYELTPELLLYYRIHLLKVN